MKRVRLIISGDVQGVGFRAWAVGQAQDLLITGWVKNRDDGAVEIVAEGSHVDLKELIKHCYQGPSVAKVQYVDVLWENATNEFMNFDVVL